MVLSEQDVLVFLENSENHVINDTAKSAKQNSWDHQELVGILKRLEGFKYVKLTQISTKYYSLSSEALEIISKGSAEARCFLAVPTAGITKKALDDQLGPVSKIGWAQCMKNKWLSLDKKTSLVTRSVPDIEDVVRTQLKQLQDAEEQQNPSLRPKDADLSLLQKRQLISSTERASYKVEKGENFSTTFRKPVSDLTPEMIANGSWKTTTFKEYNLNASGILPEGGNLHPLLKVRTQFREIFLEMGFQEMSTNNFVENSFWNFDALFQPQQHPVRDAHDTFFISDPELTPSENLPAEYLQRVKLTHENGRDTGSIGWRYDWSEVEARKNIMRTHTTAVSARMLYAFGSQVAQGKEFQPAKLFSIDRVFRNEATDATHLAEFHQIEGVVIDYDLTLGHLMGVLQEFFHKLGITDLLFKPAYNPYTEPSMEVFSYHAGLKKWVEVGNSGVFRPEMLLPMNLPPNVRAIAWGLSLERPTMIKYNISNIRDLVGHKINMKFIKENPICRLDR